MRMLPGSKAPEIIARYEEGLRPAEIAKTLNCSRSNVHKTLRRHLGDKFEIKLAHTRISPLTMRDMDWLQAEARRIGTRTADLARAMLTDAIYEARHGKD